jgi:heme/copper-type cytochrome/quinol oxidase subunit 4
MIAGLRSQPWRYLIGLIGIWLLLGLEIGVFYSHAPWPVLVPVAMVAGLCEWLIIILFFLHFKKEPWGFSVVLFPLLLLAVLLVGTLNLLLRVFFE